MGDQPRDGAAGGRQGSRRARSRCRRATPRARPTSSDGVSLAVDELNKDPAGIVHCWKETELLRAWEGPVQVEAAGKVNKLFPNLSRGDDPPTDLEEDLEAGFM